VREREGYRESWKMDERVLREKEEEVRCSGNLRVTITPNHLLHFFHAPSSQFNTFVGFHNLQPCVRWQDEGACS